MEGKQCTKQATDDALIGGASGVYISSTECTASAWRDSVNCQYMTCGRSVAYFFSDDFDEYLSPLQGLVCVFWHLVLRLHPSNHKIVSLLTTVSYCLRQLLVEIPWLDASVQ